MAPMDNSPRNRKVIKSSTELHRSEAPQESRSDRNPKIVQWREKSKICFSWITSGIDLQGAESDGRGTCNINTLPTNPSDPILHARKRFYHGKTVFLRFFKTSEFEYLSTHAFPARTTNAARSVHIITNYQSKKIRGKPSHPRVIHVFLIFHVFSWTCHGWARCVRCGWPPEMIRYL